MDKETSLILAYNTMEELLKNHAYSASVWGGAARDYILDREIKDVDVFARIPTNPFTAIKFRAYLAKEWKPVKSGPYEGKSSVFKVYERPDVNLIVIEPAAYSTVPDFITNTFDIGLCMVGYDLEGSFRANDVFTRDVESKTLTIYPRKTMTPGQIHRAIFEHAPRLKAKYPEYDVSVNVDMILPRYGNKDITEDSFIMRDMERIA